MIRKIRVPGIGEVEIDLLMHPSVPLGTLNIQKPSAKFYIVRYREFHEPTDMMIITGIKGHAEAERADYKLAEQRRKVREDDDLPGTVAGHIGPVS